MRGTFWEGPAALRQLGGGSPAPPTGGEGEEGAPAPYNGA